MAEQGMKTAAAASEPEKVRVGLDVCRSFLPYPQWVNVSPPLSVQVAPLPQTSAPSGKHVCAEQLSTVSTQQWGDPLLPLPTPSSPTHPSR